MERIEIWKIIGSSFGYILSAIALATLIVKHFRGKLGGFVKRESKSDSYDERLKKIEETLTKINKDNLAFQEQVLSDLKRQQHAAKQTLANDIEDIYNRNKANKSLTPVELKKITSSYAVYHGEFDGNSYISTIYTEMIEEWEHL